MARIYVDHVTNDKGEVLARVWENPGFHEIYDFKGQESKRRRLLRKQEQIFNHLDATKQLFQKVYYNPSLTQPDEVALREAFTKYNGHHDTTDSVIKLSCFVAYWPITYLLARRVRPFTVLAFTGVYYFGVYQRGLLELNRQSLQASLNRAASPLAQKYGIKPDTDYI